jgi:hypothetical protein
VPLVTIRKQLKMGERKLRRCLAFAKANPDAPVADRKRNPAFQKEGQNTSPHREDDAAKAEFVNQHQHWTAEEWKQVMFSDESHLELHFASQADRCRRPRGSDRCATKFIIKTKKHMPKVMAWGCFGWSGRGGLEFLQKGEMMNGTRYRQL